MADCIFCKIISGEIPCEKVFESDALIAFNDINPKAKVHILIVPKKHIESVKNLEEADKELTGELVLVAQKIAKEKNLLQQNDEKGLEEMLKKIIDVNPNVVKDYKAGKESALMFFVGQAMKESKGAANPSLAKEVAKRLLK